jgi:SEL1 protein
MISRFLPNIQGHGPIASAMRIVIKLRNKSWLPRFLASRSSSDNSGRKRQDTLRAVKVVDLLTHAAELGHTDALYMLAKISLVRVPSSAAFLRS